MIAVEGSMQNNNYESNGVKQYTYIVVVENVEFGGGKNSNQSQSSAPPPQQTAAQQTTQNNNNMSLGSLSEFEEILSDGDVPF